MTRLPQSYLQERTDAGETAFVTRALEYIETQTYDILFPPLEGRKYVPIMVTGEPGAKVHTYRQYKKTGMAKIVTEEGQDLPTAGFSVAEFFRQYYRLGVSYEYTLDDLLAAQLATRNGQAVNIDLSKAEAARTAMERAIDLACAIGSATSSSIPGASVGIGPDVGMTGLLNQASASTYTPATGAAGSTAWSLKTPDEKIADIVGLINSQVDGTYKIHTPNRILMPIAQYNVARGQRMGDGSDDNVISYLLKTYAGLSIDSWQFCKGAGTAGVDRMVAFNSDPKNLRMVISQEFMQMPPQYQNFRFKIPCGAKILGCICPYPLSVTYMDGI